MQGPAKICPKCQLTVDLHAPLCPRCGHQFRTKFADPVQPGATPQPAPTQVFYPPAQAPQAPQAPMAQPMPHYSQYGGYAAYGRPMQLMDLEERYRTAKKTFTWTLWAGLLCFFPIWIITYIEWTKMTNAKREVAMLGINPEQWARSIY